MNDTFRFRLELIISIISKASFSAGLGDWLNGENP
ncbi:hypothetical protein T03_10021 [Trichinella britovi]|uniref:Uncharacterized protein n=1 Tax=Trichinella britovi TaxID=45882 RepID=A0A0V1C4C3_TRIBR|nr:hypothetical protein T03_10021 [Trichinella britovi]